MIRCTVIESNSVGFVIVELDELIDGPYIFRAVQPNMSYYIIFMDKVSKLLLKLSMTPMSL